MTTPAFLSTVNSSPSGVKEREEKFVVFQLGVGGSNERRILALTDKQSCAIEGTEVNLETTFSDDKLVVSITIAGRGGRSTSFSAKLVGPPANWSAQLRNGQIPFNIELPGTIVGVVEMARHFDAA